jgi:hypothetical protein
MLRVNRQIFNNIKYPNYIIFNSLIKTNFNSVHEEMKNSITFYEKDVKKIMSYNEIDNLFKKYKRQNNLLDYHKVADIHTKDFLTNLNNYPTHLKKIIINEFSENTYFSRFYEDFNLTNLMRKFEVKPAEIFSFLVQPHKDYTDSSDFYNKYNLYQKFYTEKFSNMELERKDSDYIYFDYYNNIRLKCNIPKTLDLPITINIRRLDYGFYPRLFNFLAYKLENNPDLKNNNNYKIYEPSDNDNNTNIQISDKKTNNNNISISDLCSFTLITNNKKNIKVEKFNEKINKTIIKPIQEKFSNSSILYNNIIENKLQCWFNHRFGVLDKTKLWDYMMDDYYYKYLKNNEEYLEIANYFSYENDKLKINYESNFDITKLSIVNMLIYGKSNINQEILERLLPLIRFNENTSFNFIQLDNYAIINVSRGNDEQSYEIIFKDDNIDELEYVDKEIDKQKIVRGLLKLMNEVNPKYLNFNNYYQIALWENKNDSIVQCLNNIRYNNKSQNKSYVDLVKNLNLNK